MTSRRWFLATLAAIPAALIVMLNERKLQPHTTGSLGAEPMVNGKVYKVRVRVVYDFTDWRSVGSGVTF